MSWYSIDFEYSHTPHIVECVVMQWQAAVQHGHLDSESAVFIAQAPGVNRLYFTQSARRVAQPFGATPCQQPYAGGLMLLVGRADAWRLLLGHSRQSGETVRFQSPKEQLLAGIHVLLCVNASDLRTPLEELLSAQGSVVTTAQSCREAVSKVLAARPCFDVVLMDVSAPDQIGYAAAAQIRATPGLEKLPLIGLTQSWHEEDWRTCVLEGMSDHVGPHPDATLLVATILQHVERRSLPARAARTTLGDTTQDTLTPTSLSLRSTSGLGELATAG